MERKKVGEIVDNAKSLGDTVKRLEGQLGQLNRVKKYNSELRAVLVFFAKSQGQGQELQHVQTFLSEADAEDDQGEIESVLYPDSSLSSVVGHSDDNDVKSDLCDQRINETATNNPLLIPEVLDMIFRFLGGKSVYNTRLVCKNWNRIAMDVISKHNPPCCVNLEDSGGLEHLPKFRSILRDSDYPGTFMQSVISSGCFLADEECRSLFKEFGGMVKVLKIRDCSIRFSLLKSILEWCPNLEDLRLKDLYAPYDPVEDYDFNVLEKDSTILNQKLSRLYINEEEYSELNVQFLISIVKMSPNLKCLKNHGFDTSLVRKFASQLKKLPEITNKFEELKIDDGDWYCGEKEPNLFQIYLDMELSSNLKAVTLKSFKGLPKEEISSLLCKLGSHLETLTMTRRCDDDCVGEDEEYVYDVTWKTSLPNMPKLRVFRNLINDTYRLKSIDFLEKMPNLERLVLAGVNFKPDSPPSDKSGEALFSNSINRVPHLNLKELILDGKINSATTTASINQALPNLSKLYLTLGHGYVWTPRASVDALPANQISEKWFEKTCEGISKMQSLRTLYVDFGEYLWDEAVNLTVAFTKLHDLPNLRYLTFISGDKGVAGSTFVDALKSLLSKAHKLQHFQLINFKMPLTLSTSFSEWLANRRTTTWVEFTYGGPSYEFSYY